MAYHPSAFCDRSRQVVAFLVSIGLVVSSLVVPWLTSTASASAPVVTNYTDPSISAPFDIAPGPDGALWFTNAGNNSIGRITTSGVVTSYPVCGEPQDITAGPDGALWFTAVVNNPSAPGAIGRITTGGVVTCYGTGIGLGFSGPGDITAGPDGALWFTNSPPSSARSAGSPPAGPSRTTPTPALAAQAASPPVPTAPCGSPTVEIIPSDALPPAGWSRTTPTPVLRARGTSPPVPTAPCGSLIHPQVQLDRPDHHQRGRHELHRPQH